MMNDATITDVSGLIVALGGTEAVGAMCGGIGKTAISHWRVNNSIPQRHRYRLFRESEQRGLSVSSDLFEADAA